MLDSERRENTAICNATTCPSCGNPHGMSCTTPKGRVLGMPHRPRRLIYQRARRLRNEIEHLLRVFTAQEILKTLTELNSGEIEDGRETT